MANELRTLLTMKICAKDILWIYIMFLPSVLFAQGQITQQHEFRTRKAESTACLVMENTSISKPEHEETFAITITVTGIRNTKGVLRFKFYDKDTPFPDDKGFLRIAVAKTEVVDGKFTATYYGFPSQHMGIALLDDENDNWELDMGWFLPKEGHAFSNYYHSALRRPVYSDFSFLLEGDTQVEMKMKYY